MSLLLLFAGSGPSSAAATLTGVLTVTGSYQNAVDLAGSYQTSADVVGSYQPTVDVVGEVES